MGISSILILVFFCVYVSSCFVTCGKLFLDALRCDYTLMMLGGGGVRVIYTTLGGFLAESSSDFLQSDRLDVSLVLVLRSAPPAGGLDLVLSNMRTFPLPGILCDRQSCNDATAFSRLRTEASLRERARTVITIGSYVVGARILRVTTGPASLMAIRKCDELTRAGVSAQSGWYSVFAAVAIGWSAGRCIDGSPTSSASENVSLCWRRS